VSGDGWDELLRERERQRQAAVLGDLMAGGDGKGGKGGPNSDGDWWSPRPVSDFRASPIDWLWGGYLPLARPAILSAREGTGKSLVVAWLAARTTLGGFPGSLHGQPARAVIVAAEDDASETWKPNLYAAGADLGLVLFQDADPIEDLAADGVAETIAGWARQHGVALLVLDALLDHLGGAEVDEYRPRHVRRAMKPLRTIARESGATVLGLLHPPKGGGTDFRSQVAASHQFVAVARTGLLLAVDPDSDSDRELVLLRGKGNLGPTPPTLRLRIETRQLELDGHALAPPLVRGFDPCDLTLDDLLGGRSVSDRGESALDDLEKTLRQNPEGCTPQQLAAVLDRPERTIRHQLQRLHGDGRASILAQQRGSNPAVWGP
jgi:AAA domain